MSIANAIPSIEAEIKKISKDLLSLDNLRRTLGWSINDETRHNELKARQNALSAELETAA